MYKQDNLRRIFHLFYRSGGVPKKLDLSLIRDKTSFLLDLLSAHYLVVLFFLGFACIFLFI